MKIKKHLYSVLLCSDDLPLVRLVCPAALSDRGAFFESIADALLGPGCEETSDSFSYDIVYHSPCDGRNVRFQPSVFDYVPLTEKLTGCLEADEAEAAGHVVRKAWAASRCVDHLRDNAVRECLRTMIFNGTSTNNDLFHGLMCEDAARQAVKEYVEESRQIGFKADPYPTIGNACNKFSWWVRLVFDDKTRVIRLKSKIGEVRSMARRVMERENAGECSIQLGSGVVGGFCVGGFRGSEFVWGSAILDPL